MIDADKLKKAIEEFKENIKLPFGSTISDESSEIAISALEEIQQYRALGTVEEIRELMEKQRGKRPKTILRHRGGIETEHCPNCDLDYQVDRRYTIDDDYCPACGKLLDSSFRNFCGNCGQAIELKKGGEDRHGGSGKNHTADCDTDNPGIKTHGSSNGRTIGVSENRNAAEEL